MPIDIESLKGPRYVWDSDGKERGALTGSSRFCLMESCNGRRLYVRWPDGRLTMPCSRGVESRTDGDLQILR